MNLNNESSSLKEFSLEELVKMNGDAMAVMDEVPYQPIVYAVPREWLESRRVLLEQAVQFQPIHIVETMNQFCHNMPLQKHLLL